MVTAIQHVAQPLITPSSANSCLCTGSIGYDVMPAQPADFTLTDAAGNIIAAGSAPAGNILISNLCPSVFQLTVTYGGNSESFYLNIPTTGMNPGQSAVESVCSTDGSINLNTLVVGIMPGGNWTDPMGTSSLVMPLAASAMTDGWYTYEINAGGCTITSGVYIDYIQNADPGLTTTYEICETYAPFFMTDFMQGNPDPYGQWYDAAGNEIDGYYYPATMNSGLYTYVIDTVVGCTPVFRTMNIDENAQPNAGDDTQIMVCENGVSFSMIQQVTGSPDLGGQWYAPNNAPVGNTFNPATYAEGVYRYTLLANAPCITDQSFLTITFTDQNPSGEATTLSYCENAPNVNMFNALNGTPLLGGTWTNPAGQVTDNIFDPGVDPAGVYNYYYPNVGCSPSGADVTITVENLPNAGNDNALEFCENVASVNLNGVLSVGTNLGGTWSDAQGNSVNPLFVPPANENIFVFNYLVNGNLCPDDISTFTITLDPIAADLPSFDFELCNTSLPVDLTALYPGFNSISFEYANGSAANPTFDPAIGNDTEIHAIVASTNSCPDAEGIITIDVQQPVLTSDAVNADVCQSTPTFDLNTLIPASAVDDGNWYDAGNSQVPGLISTAFIGNAQFTFVLDEPGVCGTNQVTATINTFIPNEAGQNATASFCNTDAPVSLTTLLPAASAGIGIWSYNGLPFSSDEINPAVNTTGSYMYIVPSNGPCPSDAAELFVTIQQGVQYSAGPDIEVCEGNASLQLGSQASDTGVYNWSPALNLNSSSSASPTLNFGDDINADITTTYTVLVEDGLCSLEDDVVVTVHALPEPSLGEDLEICPGDTVSLTPQTSGDCLWTPAFLFSNNTLPQQSILPLQNANVQLTVTNEFGCSAQDFVTITVNSPPSLFFNPDDLASCPPLDVEYYIDANSSNITSLEWSINGVGVFTDDTLRTSLLQTGYYDLEVTAFTEDGCQTELRFEDIMQVYPTPVAIFTTNPTELTTLDPIAEFKNLSVGALLYDWRFDIYGLSEEEEPIFEFPNEEPANFEICLRAMNEYGCADSTCRILHLDNEYILFAPNAFTPDNDGINDVFLPILKGFDEETYTLLIFDRWGEVVFSTNEVEQPWTGNVSGGNYYAKDDVYQWQIQVKDKEMAEYRTFRGIVTVIR